MILETFKLVCETLIDSLLEIFKTTRSCGFNFSKTFSRVIYHVLTTTTSFPVCQAFLYFFSKLECWKYKIKMFNNFQFYDDISNSPKWSWFSWSRSQQILEMTIINLEKKFGKCRPNKVSFIKRKMIKDLNQSF